MTGRKERLKISVFIGIIVSMLLCGNPWERQGNLMAWWGTMYPRFCFEQKSDPQEQSEKWERPKISFWLAKALERW